MKTSKLLLVAIALLATWGCIPLSLNPVYTEKDLFYEPALEGKWCGDSEDEGMQFEKGGPNAYKVTMTENGKSAVLVGRVFHLGKQVFLDLTVEDLPESADWEKIHLVPFHSFFRVTLDHDSLKLSTFDYDWTKSEFEKKGSRGPWQRLDDRYVLTGSTKSVQRYILRWVNNPKVFVDSNPLTRRSTPK